MTITLNISPAQAQRLVPALTEKLNLQQDATIQDAHDFLADTLRAVVFDYERKHPTPFDVT